MTIPTPEERPDLYDWQDCRDTPFKDPRQAPNFETLPDHLKQALEASAGRPDQTDLERD